MYFFHPSFNNTFKYYKAIECPLPINDTCPGILFESLQDPDFSYRTTDQQIKENRLI